MKSTIDNFYAAFKNQDAEAMVACYHKDIRFEDPAFGVLEGDRASNMWRMLLAPAEGKDFTVTYSDIAFDEPKGTAHWEAKYTFSQTGRKVHNKIDAQFNFKDGKIITHKDSFDLHNWASQAMGFKGRLLGGTGFFKRKLQTQTNKLLEKFEANKNG